MTDQWLDPGDFLLDDDLPPDHRSGFVAVVGRPNVGKSTLMNQLLGQKIAIVSPKPQTTRNQLMGILTLPNSDYPDLAAQVIFLDTPGLHQPLHKLGEYLVETVHDTLLQAEVIIWVADATRPPGAEEQQVASAISAAQARRRQDGGSPVFVILALNKIDLLEPEQIEPVAQSLLALYPADDWLPISAVTGHHLPDLLESAVEHLPPGPRFYPADQVTDLQTRFIVAELIREAALHTLRDEVPHALAVVVTEFTRRHDNLTYIGADLILERKSHKQIVIGEKGKTLKQIGQLARPQIEEMIETKVYLELWVKVRPKWRANPAELRWLGYSAT